MKNNEFTFAIEKHVGVMNESQNGWTKELNLVSWNGKPAKFDVRDWSPDHDRMSRGLTFDFEEALSLYKLLEQELA